jgi:two-component system, OmpR family, response regulator
MRIATLATLATTNVNANAGVQTLQNDETFGEYRFVHSEQGVFIADNFIGLTRKQYDFALLLFRNMSQPVSIAHIRQTVWNQSAAIVSRTIDSHASMIRSKLNLRPRNGYILSSIYRYGYLLEQLHPHEFVRRQDDLG